MFLYSSGVCVTPTFEPYTHTYCTEHQLGVTQMSNGPWSQKLLATGNSQLANVVYVLSLYITVKVSRGHIIFTQKNHAAHVFLLVVDGQLVTKSVALPGEQKHNSGHNGTHSKQEFVIIFPY